ncbi:MAG: penicillin-binding protein 2 [Pseudomonadota bacterium]
MTLSRALSSNTNLGSWISQARAVFVGNQNSDEPITDKDSSGILSVEGQGKTLAKETRARIIVFFGIVVLVYAVIGLRLIALGFDSPRTPVLAQTPQEQIRASRPDIVDRNGVLLATDVPSTAVYADPAALVDLDDTLDRLGTALPDLSRQTMQERLSRDSRFEWVARDLTPAARDALMEQGVPGVGFLQESRRFYPADRLASHVLGAVNVDHEGLAGVERHLDQALLSNLAALGFIDGQTTEFKAQRLSLDVRVQHIIEDVLRQSIERYQAIGATAALMDVRTGEVLGLSSLPDFNPNTREGLGDETALNRAVGGVYELGSVFKVFTLAAGLDSGAISMESMLDARRPIRIGSATINDFHARRAMLSTTDVFVASSNIGTIRIAEAMGVPVQREYYSRLGLLDRLQIELPGAATPVYPRDEWSRLSAATISFGHGLTTTPLQVLAATAATVNGGIYRNPTLFADDGAELEAQGRRVLSEQTSANMRALFEENVLRGSGRRAAVPGLNLGGKTGTAEKIVDGRYSGDHRLNSFVSAFPMSDPHYALIVVIDEPQPVEGRTSATAGLNAAPMTRQIVERVAPILGLVPAPAQD